MPMMAAYQQNDARDSARLLASMTLEGLNNPKRGQELGHAINNMYRLLNGYRSHSFYGYVDHEVREDQFSSLLANSDRHIGELRAAFDHSFTLVFDGKEPSEAIDAMKSVLQGVVRDQEVDPVPLGKTKDFFVQFLSCLRTPA